MCTVIILQGLVPQTPFAMACNRDEFFSRPARPFHRRSVDGEDVASGLDERSGGTWFGVGKNFVAALTNDRRNGTPQPKKRTRGELVMQALRAREWTDWDAWLQKQNAADFGDCFLLVSDGATSRVYANQHEGWSGLSFEAGFHVLGNYGINQDADPTYRALRAAANGWDWEISDALLQQRLRSLLSIHGDEGVCVHGDVYGTRSSAIYLHRPPQHSPKSRIWISDHAPCVGEWYEASEALPKCGG